jgi:glyoxylase-like metal-dependent hydrolase (beta-lactamase superfamily II)
VTVIDCVRTGASYGSPGHRYELVTNTWIVGDETEVVVIDPANDPEPILAAVGGRRVRSVLCTNGTVDHVNAAPHVAAPAGAPVYLHPADGRFWRGTHPDRAFDRELVDGLVIEVPGGELEVLHTPGYTRGSCSFRLGGHGVVFVGDTLGAELPKAGASPFSDAEAQIASIRTRLLVLPPETSVRPGHGDATSIGDHLDQA